MFAKLFGLPETPLVIFGVLSLTGILSVVALSGLSYYTFFVRGRKTFHPNYQPDKQEIRKAIKWSIYSQLGNAALLAPIHYLLANGYGNLYVSVDEYGWGWLLLSIPVILVLSETAIYWTHRSLHSDLLFDRIHGKHHEFKVPMSFAAFAFRPIDPFLQGLPHHICAFLFPVNIFVYMGSLVFLMFWSVSIHDRISFVRWKAINYTGHHTLHHWYSNYNFGQYFTFWDRLMGTYKSPEECGDEVPQDLLVRAQDVFARPLRSPTT